MTEHEAKIKFIENMENKYDFLPFKNFCIENGFEVMPFYIYADLIEPAQSMRGEKAGDTAKSSCCGGGEVL